MSAFIVSHNHINALVTFAVLRRIVETNKAQEVAQLLLDENAASVNARYGAGQAADFGVDLAIRFRLTRDFPAVQILKACDCFAYQACEHQGWATSRARKIIEEIKAAAVQSLPGYSEARWEID